jgi:hypothetical protein
MESAGLAPMPPLAECIKTYLSVREELVRQAKA